MGRQLAVLEEVVGQLGRKSRKRVCADLEDLVVVLHDVDVSEAVFGNEDGCGSWDGEHMSDPSQWLWLALALMVSVDVSQTRPSVILETEVGLIVYGRLCCSAAG